MGEKTKTECVYFVPTDKDIEDARIVCHKLFDEVEKVRGKSDPDIDNFLIFLTENWTKIVQRFTGLISIETQNNKNINMESEKHE